MPAISQDDQTKPQVPPGAFRVLVTGFGEPTDEVSLPSLPQPFSHFGDNPSWLAVEPLQNTTLHTDIHSKSSSFASISADTVHEPQPIHISTLRIPVVYQDVLDIVPGLHARPPHLPPDAPLECAPPPPNNYDFVFHLGVAGRGPLRMERLGHKYGYHMKDAKGKLAPVVRVMAKDFSRRGDPMGPDEPITDRVVGTSVAGPTIAESIERERLGMDMVETSGDTLSARPTRGFGAGYETLPDEITTDIDVTRLVQDLRKTGVEQIYSSMDAGHYLCDFIYYCSLAEVRRSVKPYEKRRNTQVLFLHCPPVNQPLSTEEVTDAIKRIVVWVCSEQQLNDAKEEAVVANA